MLRTSWPELALACSLGAVFSIAVYTVLLPVIFGPGPTAQALSIMSRQWEEAEDRCRDRLLATAGAYEFLLAVIPAPRR
jgi:hypothetical protein